MKNLASLLSLIILVTLPKTLFSQHQCRNIRGLGHPVNVFHHYFQQTMNVFNPSNDDLQIKMIYYKEQVVGANYHYYVFKLKNNFAERWEYVGIITFVPQKVMDSGKFTHFIVRYINSTKLADISSLLGIYELEDNDMEIPCPNMKEEWLSYLMKNPYIPTECKAIDLPDCVKSKELTKLFGNTFEFLQDVLLKFGFKVTIGELGYNRTILESYRKGFKDFHFIISAVNQIEEMITKTNEVHHDKLIINADIKPKTKCENILDLREICARDKTRGIDCLTESQARSLINYMVIHYMIDTGIILNRSVIDGTTFYLEF